MTEDLKVYVPQDVRPTPEQITAAADARALRWALDILTGDPMEVWRVLLMERLKKTGHTAHLQRMLDARLQTVGNR